MTTGPPGVKDAFLELVEKILDSPSLLEERTPRGNANPSQGRPEDQGCACTLF